MCESPTVNYDMRLASDAMHVILSVPPTPASRRPLTTAAFLRLYSLYRVLAVLAILPRTLILKLAFFPSILWQVWKMHNAT